MVERTRRFVAVIAMMVFVVVAALLHDSQRTSSPEPEPMPPEYVEMIESANTVQAGEALKQLPIKGRAPRTDYAREQFGAGWAEIEGCEMRQIILARDLAAVEKADDDCTVLSGILQDPYTSQTIQFRRGQSTSSEVQIDHVVALSDAWQKGAQTLDEAERAQFANDPLNLLAVDGPINQQKGDSDAASWLPPDRSYRCRYIARQIAVKRDYSLWVTQAEHDAMSRVLSDCPDQVLPLQLTE